jgi:hypothetical protein
VEIGRADFELSCGLGRKTRRPRRWGMRKAIGREGVSFLNEEVDVVVGLTEVRYADVERLGFGEAEVRFEAGAAKERALGGREEKRT